MGSDQRSSIVTVSLEAQFNHFSTNFYRRDCERGPIAIIYDATTYKGTPLLVCFIAGKNADQYLDKGEAELKSAVLVIRKIAT